MMTALQAVIPDQITTNINTGFVYFLSQIANLKAFSVPITDALLISIQIMGNFMIAVVSFLVIRWMIHLAA